MEGDLQLRVCVARTEVVGKGKIVIKYLWPSIQSVEEIWRAKKDFCFKPPPIISEIKSISLSTPYLGQACVETASPTGAAFPRDAERGCRNNSASNLD